MTFLIAVARVVKKPSFRFLFFPPLALFLKKILFSKIIFFAFYIVEKETPIISGNFWLGFGVKQIIDSLSFLFLLTYIGLNFNEKVLEYQS